MEGGTDRAELHLRPGCEHQATRMVTLPMESELCAQCLQKWHTNGTFHSKMGSIKDRNGMDLTEAEDIKKRWQEYTEKLYKKDLHDPDNHEH